MVKTEIRIIAFIICLCIISSCLNTHNRALLKLDDCELITYKESARLLPTERGPFSIPDDLVYAKITDRDCGNNKDEENLIRQFKTYSSALFLNDIEACKKYTFKDAVVYHMKIFPTLSENEIWQLYFSNSRGVELSDLAADQDWDIVSSIPVFFDKISSQNEIFISFGSTISLVARNYAITHRKMEKCIAHSSNGGKNWEFITLNSNSKDILSFSCSDDVIGILTKTSMLSIE